MWCYGRYVNRGNRKVFILFNNKKEKAYGNMWIPGVVKLFKLLLP